MFNKRGQVTIFIIIAIVIVVAIITVLYIQKSSNAPKTEIQIVKNYLDSCFEDKAKQVILDTAQQGFYYNLPVASINFLDEKTAYYYKDGQDIVPSITTVEQELSSAMNDKMLPCLALSQFQQQYEITRQECSSSAKVKETTVEFSISCPITLTKGVAASKLDNFKTIVSSNTEKLMNTAELIVQEYKKKPGYACVTCFDAIAQQNDVKITIIPVTKPVFEPEHIWFIVQDGKIDNQNLTLRFVADIK